MSDYTLQLKTKDGVTNFPLFLKESEDFLNDYFDKGNADYVYNDYAYHLSVTNGQEDGIRIDSLFVNNERIEDYAFLAGRRSFYMFLECFGVVKVEVIVDGVSYVTSNIRVIMKETSINASIINMINYIYNNCDNYLYEEHKYSKAESGVMPDANISIDAKLSLLNEIYEVYVKGYNILKHSMQTKLINKNKVGDFNELQNIRPDTIYYIVNHPEELEPINYNSGISINKQYYQPRKTLVQSVAYSDNIYENQVIVGFLKTVIRDLEEIRFSIEARKARNTSPYRSNGYIDSAYYIYTWNVRVLNNYLESIDESLEKIKKVFLEYKKIFDVSDLFVVSSPRYTNIFRRIMPYNIIFEKILKWFNCGKSDLLKSDLLLSFVSVSKIYEYFCLLKINRSFEKCGYNFVHGFPFKYKETRYYRNTTYNNTFKFSKDNIQATVYYQPIIYGKMERERPNGIGLFRNTTVSIKEPTILAMLDEYEAQCGNYYTPDYLVKISTNNITNYYIFDAKHSHPKTLSVAIFSI